MPDNNYKFDFSNTGSIVQMMIFLAIFLAIVAGLFVYFATNLINENNDLKRQLQEKTPQVERLQKENEGLVTENQSLKEENIKLTAQNQSYSQEKERLVGEVSDLKTRNESLNQELVLKTNKLQEQVDTLNVMLGALKNKYTEALTQNSMLVQINRQLQDDKNKFEEKNQFLETENARIQEGSRNVLASSVPWLGLMTLLGSGLGNISGTLLVALRLKNFLAVSASSFMFAVFTPSKKIYVTSAGKISAGKECECSQPTTPEGLTCTMLSRSEIKEIIALRRKRAG